MPSVSKFARLPGLPPPVLTVYLDTNPANPRNQGNPRGYQTWLKSSGTALARELAPEQGKQVRRQIRKVGEYLQGLAKQSRGLVIFAGPEVWETVPMQMAVHDEIHWGKPSLEQMAWLLDEHRPRGVVMMDGLGARFFRFWLGSVAEDESMAFLMDQSDWRKPHLVGPGSASSRVSKRHGVQRDRVADRESAHRNRFHAALADRIVEWSGEAQFRPVVLVGEQRHLDSVVASLPKAQRAGIALLGKALSLSSPSEVQRELEPTLRKWEREYELQVVGNLMSNRNPSRAVTGMDETLYQLQRGRVHGLVMARGGLKGSARQCLNCGRVDRSADRVCAICGGERRSRTLRTVIPELASVYAVPMEIVAGDAAKKLGKAGNIGAWLGATRKPVRKIEVTPLPDSRSRQRK